MAPTLRRVPTFNNPKANNDDNDDGESVALLTPLLRPASAAFSDTSSNESTHRDMSQPATPRASSPAHEGVDIDDTTPVQASNVPIIEVSESSVTESGELTTEHSGPTIESLESTPEHATGTLENAVITNETPNLATEPTTSTSEPELDAIETLHYSLMEMQVCASQHRGAVRRTFKAAKQGYDISAAEVERVMAVHLPPAVQQALNKKLAGLAGDLDKVMREADARIGAIIGSAAGPIEEAAGAAAGTAVPAEDIDSDLELDLQLRAHAQPRAAGKEPAETDAAVEENEEAGPSAGPLSTNGKGKKKASKLGRML